MPATTEKPLTYSVETELQVDYHVENPDEDAQAVTTDLPARVTFAGPQGPGPGGFALEDWAHALAEANSYESLTEMAQGGGHYNVLLDDGTRASCRFDIDAGSSRPDARTLRGRGFLHRLAGPDPDHQAALTDETPLATVELEIEFQDYSRSPVFLAYLLTEV